MPPVFGDEPFGKIAAEALEAFSPRAGMTRHWV